MIFDSKHEEFWDDCLRQSSIQLTVHLLLAKAVSTLLSARISVPERLKTMSGQAEEQHWTPLPKVTVATPEALDTGCCAKASFEIFEDSLALSLSTNAIDEIA